MHATTVYTTTWQYALWNYVGDICPSAWSIKALPGQRQKEYNIATCQWAMLRTDCHIKCSPNKRACSNKLACGIESTLVRLTSDDSTTCVLLTLGRHEAFKAAICHLSYSTRLARISHQIVRYMHIWVTRNTTNNINRDAYIYLHIHIYIYI